MLRNKPANVRGLGFGVKPDERVERLRDFIRTQQLQNTKDAISDRRQDLEQSISRLRNLERRVSVELGGTSDSSSLTPYDTSTIDSVAPAPRQGAYTHATSPQATYTVYPSTPMYIDAASLRTTVSNNLQTVTGIVYGGDPGSLAWVRVWLADSTGQKVINPQNSTETLVGSVQTYMSGGATSFTIANLPAPVAPNRYALTLSLSTGAAETDPPVLVPLPPAPVTSPLSLDPLSLKASLANNFWNVNGTALGGQSGTLAYVRLWLGTVSGTVASKVIGPTGAETLLASAQIAFSGNTVSFVIPNVTPPAAPYRLVATIVPISGGPESDPPLLVADPVPATSSLSIDPASLKTTSANNLNTYYGTVQSQQTGIQAWVRMWLVTVTGTTPSKVYDSKGAETLLGSVPLLISNSATPFIVPNITPPVAPYRVAGTVSGANGEMESALVLWPDPIPPVVSISGLTITDPVAPVTVYSPNTSYIVRGTVSAPIGSSVLIRIWLGTTSGQKLVSSTGTEQLVASTTVVMAATPMVFQVTVPLTQNSVNTLVATATDTASGTENSPVPMALITHAAAPTSTQPVVQIIDPTMPVTVYAPTTTYVVRGSASNVTWANPYLRLWQGSSPGQKGTLILSKPLTVSSGNTTFDVPVLLAANSTSYYSITIAADAAGTDETTITPVQPITQSTASHTAPVITITDPVSQATVASSIYTLRGNVMYPPGPNPQLLVWHATAPGQKGTRILTVPLPVGITNPMFVVPVLLQQNTANYFNFSVASDASGTGESGYVSSPAIIQSLGTYGQTPSPQQYPPGVPPYPPDDPQQYAPGTLNVGERPLRELDTRLRQTTEALQSAYEQFRNVVRAVISDEVAEEEYREELEKRIESIREETEELNQAVQEARSEVKPAPRQTKRGGKASSTQQASK